jgi:hypothetical protein
MTVATAKDQELTLIEHIEKFVYDPLGFVYYIFDWGNGRLKDEEGPDKWQAEILRAIGDGSLTTEEALQLAARSGHGIGKTALIAWIILWFSSTRPHPQIVVTANTKPQLETKTWRELAKWHKLAANEHWFKWTATKFYHIQYPETWFAVNTPWSKERSEAFAGTHEKHVLIIYDEASAIDDIIWEVTEGAMTTPGAMWIVFGNPTRNTGRFSECFKRYRHRWKTWEIDSRQAKKADQDKIRQWIEDYGEDSDFVRVRVKGQEPRTGFKQFIGNELVEEAMNRSIHRSQIDHAPKVLGVDIARFGDDQSVFILRQGLMAFQPRKFRNINTMELGDLIHEEATRLMVDGIILDMGSFGAAVFDYLTEKLGRRDVVGINFGGKPIDEKIYKNKRAEMYGRARDWLRVGGCLPDDRELRDDLTGPEYWYDIKERIQLEPKEDMKERGLASPDCGDAFCLTFAADIHKKGSDYMRKDVDTAPDWKPGDFGRRSN